MCLQPVEIYVDDEAKLTLHGLVQHYIMLNEPEKNRKLNELLDALDFNQVHNLWTEAESCACLRSLCCLLLDANWSGLWHSQIVEQCLHGTASMQAYASCGCLSMQLECRWSSSSSQWLGRESSTSCWWTATSQPSAFTPACSRRKGGPGC